VLGELLSGGRGSLRIRSAVLARRAKIKMKAHMAKMRRSAMKTSLSKRIINRRNLFYLLSICAAIIVVLINFFRREVGAETIGATIVILLILVATTNWFEHDSQWGFLLKLQPLLEKMKPHGFVLETERPHLDELTADASEFFVAGAQSFNLVRSHMGFWEKWIEAGKTLKILVQNPCNEGLKYLELPMFKYSYENYISEMKGILHNMKQLRTTDSDNFQIRVSDACLSHGVVIVDGHKGGKIMTVAFYLPNCDSSSRPHVILEKKNDYEWFNLFYSKYYEYLWNKSRAI
jgi:hypothetical protein